MSNCDAGQIQIDNLNIAVAKQQCAGVCAAHDHQLLPSMLHSNAHMDDVVAVQVVQALCYVQRCQLAPAKGHTAFSSGFCV